jgi:hypothetical protein
VITTRYLPDGSYSMCVFDALLLLYCSDDDTEFWDPFEIWEDEGYWYLTIGKGELRLK